MINPQLLTKENGFEDGVVVEIALKSGDVVYGAYRGVYRRFIARHRFIVVTDTNEWTSLEKIQFIRPLTGPMSIWCHAPEWAEYCGNNEEETSIYWSKTESPQIRHCGVGMFTARPFWAKRSGE